MTDIIRPRFFIGLHQPSDAWRFRQCMISVNRLEHNGRMRLSDIAVNDWILDSGAFSRLATGKGHMSVENYIVHINRWTGCGNLLAAVSQDYMCEPFMLQKAKEFAFSDGTVKHHQELTIARYDALVNAQPSAYIMPVLQGYEPGEYITHIRQYEDRLIQGAWVGVGSVCKRNSDSQQIERVLTAINSERPDLLLHGFGLKSKALTNHAVNEMLFSTDSMAWSYAARMNGHGANDPQNAQAYIDALESLPVQMMLF
ncbi:hypothetical protein LCGC14_2013170 [marine sediment metagenome]|uniref:DeoxyPurine in DNA protein A domain-containing protein n=1 Tax=marine sediment metagenome TaxID=412755 RepID=A0A0F9HWY5_9ZZZZ